MTNRPPPGEPPDDNPPQDGPPHHAHEIHQHYGVLSSPDAVEDLTDKLTGYMTEIELGGLSDIIGQVLDDFLDQSGGMPENLQSPQAFEQISRNQLAVTLAYQLGRLEGRSPQLVQSLIDRAIAAHGFQPLDESPEITDADLTNPKVQVYPRIRRIEYIQPQILQIQPKPPTPPN